MFKNKLSLRKPLLLIFLSTLTIGFSQSTSDQQLIDDFEKYAEAPRELVYVHLNKSTYIEGEMLGFTAYVFDKSTKERSQMTTNLYCTISDENGQIIKKQMVMVNDGVASNVFYIDEEFKTGTYLFKSYTNWMKNFDEQNHYQQSFYVLDADPQTEVKTTTSESAIDVQILGEGGHILYDVENTAGIIAKNNAGLGIPFAKGKITDANNAIISEFTLNQFGIAKVLFSPENGKTYYLNLDYNDNSIKKEITDLKVLGFTMSLTETSSNLALKFFTNDASLSTLRKKNYKLVVHNGDVLNLLPFNFNDSEVIMVLPKTDLLTGINIFTVFDENNKPLLERLYFNSIGLKTTSLKTLSVKEQKDSLTVNLSLNGFNKDQFQNVSVSVLPSETKSYNPQNTIISQIYLQPYIKTPIQNAAYYFSDLNRKTAYELDALLLTQGWSSYDWNTIFNFNEVFIHPFERGIDVVATINTAKDGGTFLVYPLKNNTTQIFALGNNENVFTQKRVIPVEGETFRVGQVNTKKKSGAPGVYPQFFPSLFPSFDKSYDNLVALAEVPSVNTVMPLSLNSWNRGEQLDEVVIEGQRAYTRLEKLKRKTTNTQIYEIDNLLKSRGMPLWQYINSRTPFRANFDLANNSLAIWNPRVTWGPSTPMVYLDDALLTQGASLDILSTINMEIVDYIEVDAYGIGGGLRGGQAGFIKIYTSPDFFYRNDNAEKAMAEFQFPLTFSENKTYYTPLYQFYNTTFFKEYGTIGWFPDLKPDANGNMSFKLANTQTKNISFYIEGVTNDDVLISEIRTYQQ